MMSTKYSGKRGKNADFKGKTGSERKWLGRVEEVEEG